MYNPFEILAKFGQTRGRLLSAIAEQNKTNDELRRKVSELEEKNEKLSKTLDVGLAKSASDENQVFDLMKRLRDAEYAVETADAVQETLKQDLSRVEKRLEESERVAKELRREYQAANRDVSSKDVEIHDLTAHLSEAEARSTSVKKERDDFENDIVQIMTKIRGVLGEYEIYEKHHQDAQACKPASNS